MKLISLVFSFKNEEKNIIELVERTHVAISSLKNWKYELIFVNDDSNDNSEKILEKLQDTYPIKIINMSRTFGVGPCVLAGFQSSKGDCIVYMDSDLQDPPELIPKLVDEHEKGYDIVHTIRTNRLGESRLRLVLTKLAYKIINYLSNINLPVEAGDFKLISRRALNNILKQKEFRPYIRGLSVWVGYSQTNVKYIRDPRKLGERKFPLFSSQTFAEFTTGVTAHSLKPLYFGIIVGFISILFSIALIIYALYMKATNNIVPGTASIIITISFFSGTILLTLGIIGIYLARIFENVKGTDRYIIKDIKDFKIKSDLPK